jgi:hypothetical protein
MSMLELRRGVHGLEAGLSAQKQPLCAQRTANESSLSRAYSASIRNSVTRRSNHGQRLPLLVVVARILADMHGAQQRSPLTGGRQ